MEKKEDFNAELATQYSILIKANGRKEKQRFIILAFILCVTLIAVFVSVFFSYQALKNTKNSKDDQEKINTFYQVLSTTYNGSSTLNLSGIGNGYSLSNPKTIQITNEGNTDIIFNIKLSDIKTSLLSTNNLVYTITSNGQTSITKELPLSESIIVSEVTIKPDTTINYIISVAFNGTITEGDYSNYYNSNIIVEQIDNKSSLIE